MRGHRDVPDASPIVSDEHQDEQETVGRSRDYEEISRHDLANVIPQERTPGLGGRLASAPEYLATVVSQTLIPSFSSSP
jgi:hypothetical protein